MKNSQQKFTNFQNHTQQKNPFMYYSAFKLAIYFKNNPRQCVPVHSIETKSTFAQVYHNMITEIELHRAKGFVYCLELAESMASKIHSATLYSAYDPDQKFATFNGKWFHYNDPEFTEKNMIVTSKKFSCRNGFVILHDIEANLLTRKFSKP